MADTKPLGQIAYEGYRRSICGPNAVTWQEFVDRDSEEIEGWQAAADAVADEAFTSGIDEAVRQANEELARTGSPIRFLNAGLNTVCISSVDDPEFTRLSALSK